MTLFFKLLAKKKLVGGRGLREKLQGMEESEADSFNPGLKLEVKTAVKRGVDPVWSSLHSFSSLLYNVPGSQQAQVQLRAHHCAGHAVAIQNHALI